MPNGCCGQPTRRREDNLPNLPQNPQVTFGVDLLYLGGSTMKLRGAETGLFYHVSRYRRQFTVHRDDASAILRRRDVILAPA